MIRNKYLRIPQTHSTLYESDPRPQIYDYYFQNLLMLFSV